MTVDLVAGIIMIVLFAIGIVIGYFVRRLIAESRIGIAEKEAKNIIEKATTEAQVMYKEKLFEAKEKVHQLLTESEQEINQQRSQLKTLEVQVDQKKDLLDNQSKELTKREHICSDKEKHVTVLEQKLTNLHEEQLKELEHISSLSVDEARKVVLSKVESDMKQEVAQLIKDMEQKALTEADRRARDILALTLQRCAVDHVAETTVAVITLPNDEMKGRIIGREGRNIRTLETLTGADLIIDDTPEAVVLSSFDPVRREVARISLERLIADGRIHPASIEETVTKAIRDVDDRIREYGEQAAFETDIYDLHPEMIKMLGRMRFRTSYGQNALKHSLEVAHLTGLMAAELGEDVKLAKRAGLLHDIGKAIDHEIEGSHVEIGIELAKKYKEHEVVINSISSHHGDEEATSVIAVLVKAADALSAARPGARKETLEKYIKRLEKLEAICEKFEGVDKSYAVQAGRECRIIVRPEEITDSESILLARNITKEIEGELKYPGQIKVIVIRETRAIEYAK